MLVLGRKINQRIVIGGGNIRVSVIGLEGKTIRIGIEAPDDVNIVPTGLLDSEEGHHILHKKADVMLIVDRDVGEGIMIGGNILVKVIKGGEKRVEIGVEAPVDIPIDREELLDEGRARGKERMA